MVRLSQEIAVKLVPGFVPGRERSVHAAAPVRRLSDEERAVMVAQEAEDRAIELSLAFEIPAFAEAVAA